MGRIDAKKAARRAIKGIVGAGAGHGRPARRPGLGELRADGSALHLDAGWLAASSALYLVGLSRFGAFFGRIMASSPTPIGGWPALRAYLIGHLGKYVPGKALVVVMRVGLTVPYGARPATAAFATLYETLVMMASGGLLAGVIFASGRWPSRWPSRSGSAGRSTLPLMVLAPGDRASPCSCWPRRGSSRSSRR